MSEGNEVEGVAIPQTPEVKATNSFYRKCEARADKDAEEFDAEGFSAEQTGRIALAETEDEMWDADEGSETESSKELPDVEMEVHSFTVHHGQTDLNQGKFKFFFVVSASRLDNGAEFVWTTGVEKICIKLMWLEDHDALPAQCVIRAYKTSLGRERLALRPIAKRAVKGSRA